MTRAGRGAARLVSGVALSVAAIVLGQGAACAQAGTLGVPQGEPDKAWTEAPFEMPGPPDVNRLMAFRVSATGEFSFAVDPASLSVGKDGVVRFTVVATSSSGVRNVSFEAMRCTPRLRRVVAYGRPDGTWGPAQSSDWRTFPSTTSAYYGVLYRDFFCPENSPIASPAEGIAALRAGMHPRALGRASQ